MSESTAVDFRYVDLNDVDPSFQPLDAEVYNLRISKIELKEYTAQKDSKTYSKGETFHKVQLTLTVVDHTKFTGRRLWDSFFPNDFALRTLRRIADAAGVAQKGTLENWMTEISAIQPTVKLKVDVVPDTNYDGTPNTRTVRADGSPANKNQIDWKGAITPAQ